ncbi:MAG: FG-GAP repeat protein [Spirochaetota bacterium]
MKLRLVLFIFASGALAAESPRSAKFPAALKPEKGRAVRIVLEKTAVHAILPSGKKQRLSDYDTADVGTEAAPLLVADFNFDGYDDVAVLEGNGYGGVNLFYRVWLWNSAALEYREFPTSISNPSLSAKNRTVVSAQRSGPRWYQTVFRAGGGELKVFLESQMLNSGTHWGVTFADGTRAVADTQWFDGDMKARPQATGIYAPGLCAGDKKSSSAQRQRVKLIDFREEGAEVLIAGEKAGSQRWISADCLAEN